MSIQINRQKFFDSDEAKAIRVSLEEMTADPSFNTKSIYAAYSSSDVTFVDRHMKYLGDHQKVNPHQYLSNLRLMTRLTARSK